MKLSCHKNCERKGEIRCRKNRERYSLHLDGSFYYPKIWVDNILSVSQQRTLSAKKARSFLGCIKKGVFSRSGEMILFGSHEMHLEIFVQSWDP